MTAERHRSRRRRAGPTRKDRTLETVPVYLIDFDGRHRKDMGDLEALAQSIADVGMLQPIVVRRLAGGRYRLIAGERRLRAVARLDWETVPAHVVDDLVDAAALLRAERDENTCRKPFTPSEAVSVGMALEDL